MKARNTLLCCILTLTICYTSFAQTADVTEGCFPLTVNFTPPGGASDFYWDFGNNVTSEEANAAHVYTTAGNYTATFSESPAGPVIGSIEISVYEEPDLQAAADPSSGCGPLLVQFNNNSVVDPNINVIGYLWDFGDGSSTTGEAPNHLYTATGTFDVFLQITTNFPSCNTTVPFTDMVTVVGPPNVGFVTNPNPPNSCDAPLTVTFTNTTPNQGNYTFLWDFGNGQTSNDPNPAAVTFTEEGNFTVTLSAFDDNQCSGTFSQVVSVGPPLVSFSSSSDTVCVGEVVQLFNNSAPGTYQWDFGSSATPSTTNATSPLVIFNQGGLINYTLTVTTAAGCTNDSTGVIFVDAPDPTFTAAPTYSCTNELTSTFTPNNLNAASYFWDFGDDSTSTEQIPTHTFINQDTTTYSLNGLLEQIVTLTVVSPAGCVDSFTFIDTIHQPNALFMPDVVDGCAPLTVTFADSSTNDFDLLEWDWDFGDGTTITANNDEDQEHTYSQAGSYPVVLTITDELGCRDTSYSLIIEVGDALSPDFTVDQTEICPGDTVTFTPLPFPGDDEVDAWHFETDEARSFHCADEDELSWSFITQTGGMDATLYVEYNGCLSSVTQTDLITVNGPIAHIDYLVDCATPLDIAFRDSSDDATSVLWEFGDSTSSTINDLIHTYDTTGDYTVYLTAENPSTGCPASIDSVVVKVRDIHAEMVPLDSLLCLGNPYDLDASPSRDVDTRCWKGHTWYFSDPNDRPITSQMSVVEHFFESPGDNLVTLITEDINGCEDTTSQIVRVFGVYPDFVADDNLICIGQLVNFDEFTTGDTTLTEWSWDFGDGGTSTEQDPGHTFTAAPFGDSVFVNLSVTDVLGCSGVSTLGIPIYEPESVVSAFPTTNICVGDQVNFAASDYTVQGSFLNYSWNFGNGLTSANAAETVTYPDAGNFLVTLNYTEDATGCPGPPVQLNVNVQDYPDAAFTSNVDNEPIICYPQILNFQDASTSTSPLTYFWNLGNGQSTIGNPVTSGFDKGTYDVTLTVSTSNGCLDDVTRTFTLVGPEGAFSLDRYEICNGDDITFKLLDTVDVTSFSWDFGDGIVQQGGSPATHTYNFTTIPPNGQTTASLVLQGQNGICEFAIDTTIFIYQVIADFVRNDGIDTTVCVGDPFPLTNTSTDADIFDWNFGDGNNSTEENPTYTYDETGVFEVALAVENSTLGCTDTINKSIVVNDLPIVEAIGDTICLDDNATLSLNNPNVGSTYIWGPESLVTEDTAIVTETLSGSQLPGSTVLFTVTEIDDNGCSGSDQASVYVVPELEITGLDTLLCPGESVVLPVSDTSGLYSLDYTWQEDLAELSCQDCSFPVVNASASVIVNLEASDDFDCYTYNEDFVIDVFKLDDFEMPSAFTPDGDEINDRFIPVISDPDLQQIVQFQIFNRWGQKIFDNDDPLGWDGTYDGEAMPSDVYIYIIEVSVAGCETFSQKGDVTLIR